MKIVYDNRWNVRVLAYVGSISASMLAAIVLVLSCSGCGVSALMPGIVAPVAVVGLKAGSGESAKPSSLSDSTFASIKPTKACTGPDLSAQDTATIVPWYRADQYAVHVEAVDDVPIETPQEPLARQNPIAVLPGTHSVTMTFCSTWSRRERTGTFCSTGTETLSVDVKTGQRYGIAFWLRNTNLPAGRWSPEADPNSTTTDPIMRWAPMYEDCRGKGACP